MQQPVRVHVDEAPRDVGELRREHAGRIACAKLRTELGDQRVAPGEDLESRLEVMAGVARRIAIEHQRHARKFDVDDAWTGAEAELAMPGLDRPVLLRRRAYHDILRAILDDAGKTFADLVVIGDIFELDLAMPLALGARVGLVSSARTPTYERAFVEAHPRAQIIGELAEIPAFAFGS